MCFNPHLIIGIEPFLVFYITIVSMLIWLLHLDQSKNCTGLNHNHGIFSTKTLFQVLFSSQINHWELECNVLTTRLENYLWKRNNSMILVSTKWNIWNTKEQKKTIKETIDEAIIVMRSRFMFHSTIYSLQFNLYIIVSLFNSVEWHGVKIRLCDNNLFKVLLRFKVKLLNSTSNILTTTL